MDINNNQQINTFTKGMDTDTSDMYIGEGSYRYAENLRVVTDKDGNTGELHLIEGTTKILNHKKDPQYIGTEQLLGFTSIRQYIIEVVKRGDTWGIYRSDTAGRRQLVAGWFDKLIWPTREEEIDGETVVVDDWDGKTKLLSLVTRWESKDNIKLYIANGLTEILCINIAELNQGNNFDEVFFITKANLDPIKAKVTHTQSANIRGAVIQYAYVLYKIGGNSSSISSLSNVITQVVDKVHGYEADATTTTAVLLTLPQNVIGEYVRIYRVAYSKAGQLPKVDIIYDQKCQTQTINDFGQSLQNVSSAEFIATNKLLFIAKEIESKGDYLFAGNIEYTQDEIDKLFKNFDARCYNDSSYYYRNGQKVKIKDESNNYANIPELSPDTNLYNEQFDVPNSDFNPEYWASANGVNGHGLCFNWKYSYLSTNLYYSQQYGGSYDNQTPRTYGRNEVYRFGVRLFDDKGHVSSVKWIADIKIPNYYNLADIDNEDTTIRSYITDVRNEISMTVQNVLILFIPVNTNTKYWENVVKYEIVLAKRGVSDYYKIAQGISGFPQIVEKSNDSTEICLPYFLTTDPFRIRRGLAVEKRYIDEDNYVSWDYDYVLFGDWDKVRDYDQNKNCLIYACPEYVYQPDDIKNIIDEYGKSINYRFISRWTRDAILSENTEDPESFNALDSTGHGETMSSSPRWFLRYFTPIGSENSVLKHEHSDFYIQIGRDITKDSYHQFFLSSQVMANSFDRSDDVKYTPIGGNTLDGNAWKFSFFTNMYPQRLEENMIGYGQSGGTDVGVLSVIFNDAQDPDGFAKEERPEYRSQFKTLQYSENKFFNWTNPVLLDQQLYNHLRYGEDETQESWKYLTMTGWDEADIIKLKYHWIHTDPGGDHEYLERNIVLGSYGLSFPVSPGGPNMVLDFLDGSLTHMASSTYHEPGDTPGATLGTMPCITIANLCKPAVPYGGYTIGAINDTQYLSYGCIANKNSTITMAMGDNYITMFAYCLYHNFDNAIHNSVSSAAMQYIVPVESTIDLSKQCSNYVLILNNEKLPVGDKTEGVWVQAKPSTVAGRFTQTTDMYMYNTVYSVLPDIVTYAGQDTVNAADSLYDSRIHYSQKKQNNELIDNWTSFKAIDYLDVDSRYGQITGLKLFKDKLIFLQENGAGVLSVNDRIILKDQESANIIVGNGGVLDRYDYFTTIYGMKPDQHVVEATNDALYWWDGHRREILGYTDGYNIALLQRIKNVQNYINTGDESYTPSIVCDANNKEVLFNVVNNESLVYNEQIQQFTSVYTFNPIYYCNIDGIVYLTDDWSSKSNLYTYNTSDDEAQLFEEPAKPSLKYVVNKDPIYNKVFDVQTFGGRFYGGDDEDLVNLNFDYKTPLKQHSRAEHGEGITNREYDYRLAIPRNNDDLYGGRMRGKTMECEITSDSNNKDFSIQYVTTKYRMSWT